MMWLADYDQAARTLSPPSQPGTYVVSDGGALPSRWTSAIFRVYGANCVPTRLLDATGGGVTLTSTDGGSFAGTIDLLFDGGERLTTSFEAANCAAMDEDGGLPLCL